MMIRKSQGLSYENPQTTFALMLLKKVVQCSFISGLFMALASAWVRYLAFTQTPFATGWDSYFYLVQIKSLEETGQMHSPEASLIYPYLRLFYWFSGDYVLGMKIGTAVLCGIFTLLLYRRGAAGALLGAWTVFSPHLTYFAAQYPKNLLGLVLFVAFVRALDWAVLRKPIALVLPVLLLMINYFGHRMMFGLALGYLLFWLFFRYKNQFPSLGWGALAKIGLALCAGLAFFLLAGQFFPGLAHVVDLGRLDGTLSWSPQFAPWSFVQSFGYERIGAWWLFEIIAVGCASVWVLFRNSGGFRVGNPALWVLCGCLLFPFLEWSLTGLAWRMFLVLVLLVPMSFEWINLPSRPFQAMFGALMIAALFSWKSYSPARQDPDYALFQKITQNTQTLLAKSAANSPELFIAHNALAEYFTYTTGIDAMPWLPEYPIDSSKLWRIATGVNGQTLRCFAGTGNTLTIKLLGGNYFLLPEHVWQHALQQARSENDLYFLQSAESWLNPHRIRPGFLLKRKE